MPLACKLEERMPIGLRVRGTVGLGGFRRLCLERVMLVLRYSTPTTLLADAGQAEHWGTYS